MVELLMLRITVSTRLMLLHAPKKASLKSERQAGLPYPNRSTGKTERRKRERPFGELPGYRFAPPSSQHCRKSFRKAVSLIGIPRTCCVSGASGSPRGGGR